MDDRTTTGNMISLPAALSASRSVGKMCSKNRKSSILIIYSLLHILLFIASFLSSRIFYGLIYETITIFFVVWVFSRSRSNIPIVVVAFYSLYFYQVPFVEFFSEPSKGMAVYFFHLSTSGNLTYNILYWCISVCFFWVLQVLIRCDRVGSAEQSFADGKLLWVASWLLVLMFIILSIRRAGGVEKYFLLNKLDVKEIQNTAFLSYKPFCLIGMYLGFNLKDKKTRYANITLSTIIIVFELMSQMRFMILAFIILFIISMPKIRIRSRTILLLLSLYILMFLIKKTYYQLELLVIGKIELGDILSSIHIDLVNDLLLMGETNSHLVLTANYIAKSIYTPDLHGISQIFFGAIPFFSKIFSPYVTAGEYIMTALGISWGGPASSIYIPFFLQFGIVGVAICFALLAGWYNIIYHVMKSSSVFLKAVVMSLMPYSLTYYLREEALVIFKNLFFHAFAAILAFSVAYSLMSLKSLYKKRPLIINKI